METVEVQAVLGCHDVVVFDDDTRDTSGWGVFARRFDAAGSPVAPDFRVNVYSTGAQRVMPAPL